MGLVRGIVIAFFALAGLIVGAVAFLALGLFVVSPPTIAPAAKAQPWDVTVDITDTFLSAQLNRAGTDQPVQLSNAKSVTRADGTITITGNVGGGGATGTATGGGRLPINPSAVSVAVEIVMKPGVNQEGKLTVEIVKAQFGPLPVPNQIGKLLENPVNSQIANALNGQSFAITEISLRDGAMVVRARQASR